MNVDELVRQAGERLADLPVPVPSFERLQRAARRRRRAAAGAATVAALAVTTAGVWAISGSDAGTIRSSASTTAPTAPPTTSTATTVAPNTIETSAPMSPPAERAPEDLIAILDPALDIGPAYTQGEAGKYLADAQPTPNAAAVRRSADGSVTGAVSWDFRPGDDPSKQNPAWTEAPLADGRIATRYEYPPRVSYSLQLDGGYVTASITSAAESDLVAWLEALPADTAIDTLTPPIGYELLPDVEATSGVMYFRDETNVIGEIEPVWQASVLTNHLAAETTLADWVAARFDGGGVEPIGANGAVMVMNIGGPTIVWQPDPQVIVEMYGPEANLSRFVDALRLVPRDEANLVPTALTTGPFPVAEQDVTRSVLGETSTGRFAYIQYRSGDGECFWIAVTFGGTGSCEPPLARPLCLTSNTGTSWTAVVILIDRTSADVALDVDGLPVDGATEQGVALDGTPWVSWSATDIPNGPDPSMFPGTITVEGTVCVPA